MSVGLLPAAPLTVPVVEAADLSHRRARSEFVRRLAQAELETLSRQIAGSNFLLAFADQEGVVLDLYADNRFTMNAGEDAILPGSVWTESVAGTNGLGTALAAGTAVAVTGMEHFFLKLGDISCSAAPVRDAHGQVVGVLDASSCYESRQRHTQALVQMAATHIENRLLAHQMRGQWILAVHPRAEFLGTLSTGLLAFDGQGVLVAVNGPAHHLLSGLEVVRGTRFEELFGESLDQVLARLHLGAEARLRDALGSVLVVRLVGQAVVPTPLSALRSSSLPPGPAALPAAPVASVAPVASDAVAPKTSRPFRAGESRRGPPRAVEVSTAFVAEDPAVQEACRVVEAAVHMNAPILLQGETGTGKELLARYAHQVSGRRGEFVAVNCSALSGELFEAELFGHVSGAFTGARRDGSPGLLLAADGGTLLLDEVRDLPLHLQAKLLRFLDDQLVRPGGRPDRAPHQRSAAGGMSRRPGASGAGEYLSRRLAAPLEHRLRDLAGLAPAARSGAGRPLGAAPDRPPTDLDRRRPGQPGRSQLARQFPRTALGADPLTAAPPRSAPPPALECTGHWHGVATRTVLGQCLAVAARRRRPGAHRV